MNFGENANSETQNLTFLLFFWDSLLLVIFVSNSSILSFEKQDQTSQKMFLKWSNEGYWL